VGCAPTIAGAPAIVGAQPTVRWRLTSSFPKSLDALFGAAALGEYERRWKALLRREILVGHTARRMCARLSDGRIESLFELARTDGIVPIIRATADFDRHSGLIFALLERLSFLRFFRDVRDRLGPFSGS
jgi:flavin-dependent dehydrogenase